METTISTYYKQNIKIIIITNLSNHMERKIHSKVSNYKFAHNCDIFF